MAPFSIDKPRKHGRKVPLLLRVVMTFIFLVAASIATICIWYFSQLSAVSDDTTQAVAVIPVGSTPAEIATLLEEKDLIKSATVFEWYVKLNSYSNSLRAGTYQISPSQSVEDIVQLISEGMVTEEFVTILPAQRLDQLRATFKSAGYSESEIEIALRPSTYPGHPALADKPEGKNLEGFLYPDTYQKSAQTPLTDIVELALDEFASFFTADIIAAFQAQGLTPYEGLVMSSIVEREVGNDDERRKVAQVFVKRYQEGIMLGSDPTALYGALIAGIEPSVFADTPYNTRLYPGIPPTPINNVSVDSLRAVADPADTDFLFFVSGDDGITRFSRTLAEHEALTAQYCIELCNSY